MKYLGIDFGSKRIGLAISDEAGEFSFPLTVLSNSTKLIEEISKICSENKIEVVVVGESKDFSLKENEIMKEIAPFVENLKKSINIPIYMYPEFFTSEEAQRLQGKNDMHDASAAALILKHFLSSKK